MENSLKTAQSISQSDVSQLRYQATPHDAPKDVNDEVMAHFNDPNWDFENSSILSSSTVCVEDRRWFKSLNSTDASTEADIEFQVSSWRVHDPMAVYSSKDTLV